MAGIDCGRELQMDVSWFFDPVSPFAYLQAEHLTSWVPAEKIQVRPVVLGALLSHWQTRGPAEIPRKRVQTYRNAVARAEALDIAFRFPPAHPFDPLPLLRLSIAAGGGFQAAREILRFVWRDGKSASEPHDLDDLGRRLEVANPREAISRQDVKTALRESTEAAVRLGVFGVPTVRIAGEFFWGEDATAMARRTWEEGVGWLQDREWGRAASLPIGVQRKA